MSKSTGKNSGLPERVKRHVNREIAEARLTGKNYVTIVGTIRPNLKIYLNSNIMAEKIICNDSDLVVLVADEVKEAYQKEGYTVEIRTNTNTSRNSNRITKAIYISWEDKNSNQFYI